MKSLGTLNVAHRILLTGPSPTSSHPLSVSDTYLSPGTPLNNNIRELFNLMNFLDPDGWCVRSSATINWT